jgi:hypothetical protein
LRRSKVFEHHLGAIKTPDGILLDETAIPLLVVVLEQAEFFGIPVNG